MTKLYYCYIIIVQMTAKRTIKNFEIKIDTSSAVPVYEQIKRRIKFLIISNFLEEGDALPSIRDLAAKLKVNPNTVVKAYYQLEVEGFIKAKPGSMYFVSVDRKKLKKEKQSLFRKELEEFLSKATRMGYSLQDVLQALKEMYEELKGKEEGGG